MYNPQPALGDKVLYIAPEDEASNGSTLHPAIITHVWSNGVVNLITFPDNAQPKPRTSVQQFDEYGQTSCWTWPPRPMLLAEAEKQG